MDSKSFSIKVSGIFMPVWDFTFLVAGVCGSASAATAVYAGFHLALKHLIGIKTFHKFIKISLLSRYSAVVSG